MKHLKKFENFDLGHRFTDEEENCEPCGSGGELDDEYMFNSDDEFTEHDSDFDDEFTEDDSDFDNDLGFARHDGSFDGDDSEEDEEEKNWNDEEELRLEKISTFRQFEAKKAKPDFLDLDKDGDKKESMKKAAKDAKDDKKDSKKDDKGGKGLTAAQKKLPEGLRKAIEAKNKKK